MKIETNEKIAQSVREVLMNASIISSGFPEVYEDGTWYLSDGCGFQEGAWSQREGAAVSATQTDGAYYPGGCRKAPDVIFTGR